MPTNAAAFLSSRMCCGPLTGQWLTLRHLLAGPCRSQQDRSGARRGRSGAVAGQDEAHLPDLARLSLAPSLSHLFSRVRCRGLRCFSFGCKHFWVGVFPSPPLFLAFVVPLPVSLADASLPLSWLRSFVLVISGACLLCGHAPQWSDVHVRADVVAGHIRLGVGRSRGALWCKTPSFHHAATTALCIQYRYGTTKSSEVALDLGGPPAHPSGVDICPCCGKPNKKKGAPV